MKVKVKETSKKTYTLKNLSEEEMQYLVLIMGTADGCGSPSGLCTKMRAACDEIDWSTEDVRFENSMFYMKTIADIRRK